jgi:hypothetical protein
MNDEKTALLLIPETDNSINRQAYLMMCIEKAYGEGCIPLTPALYDYTPVDQGIFIEKMLPLADIIYLFIDFGIDKKMFEVIDRSIGKKELRYRKADINKVMSSPVQVLHEVAQKTGFSVETLKGKTRKREIVDARYVYFRRAKEMTKASLAMIGSYVGKDHATVMHGIKEAMETKQVLDLYRSIYVKSKITSPSLGNKATDAKGFNSQPVTKPVLPYRSMDEREQDIQAEQPSMRFMSARKHDCALHGYRPHDS